jgi:hypothetical protein
MSKSQIDQRARPLTTPRSAAVAGIIYGILLLTAQVLLQIELQNDPTATLAGLAEQGDLVALPVTDPFAGIASSGRRSAIAQRARR